MTIPTEEQAGSPRKMAAGDVQHDPLPGMEREWTAAFNAVLDPIFIHDSQFRIIRANQAYVERAGITRDAIIGRPYWEVFPRREGPLPGCTETTEISSDPQPEFTLPDGTTYRSRAFVVSDEAGDNRLSVHLLQDVTEARGIQQELVEQERMFRLIFDNSRDGIALADISSRRFLIANPAFCIMLGYRPAEIPELATGDIYPAASLDYVQEQFSRQVSGERSLAIDVPMLRRDGTLFPAEVSTTPVTLEGQQYLLGIFRDVSERKATESTLARAHRALRTLSRSSEVLVNASDEQGLLTEVCRTAVEEGGYRLAWVGYADVGEGSPVRPVARAGHDAGYVDAVCASWSEKSPHGQGPAGRAIRDRQPVIIRDIIHDATFTPWREAALARGYGSLAVFPLRHEQTVLGVLCLYAIAPNAFDEAEIKLLTELAEDLAYGIRALRTGQAHALDTQRHQELLYATIRAIALTVEKRDPYTAGHQERVAQLAMAIAREMGMEENRVEGIRLGALIHDIGKVYIPAEILTRPGKLSTIEFELIKTHPEVGREIVAAIPFPWPVAEMIHQHHERLDGSGYPQGLKGEAIIMEARILTVADVVEAVASHRPYRAALGMEYGLEVIEAGRGTLFDPLVVDACQHLCREGGFTFVMDDDA